jgi:ABC-type bacteriocin/lantibiotic exporter with double-glycine peptidase domain
MRARQAQLAYQTDASDCGAACLVMVCAAFGIRLSLAQARLRCHVSRSGTTARAISSAAQDLGLRPQAFQLDAADIGQVRVPSIVHWNGKHFVVLRQVRRGRVIVLDPDPDRGLQELTPEQFRQGFSGTVIELDPTRSSLVPPPSGPSLSTLFPAAASTRLGLYFTGSVLAHLLSAATPLIAGTLVNHLLDPLGARTMVILAAALVAATCARAGLRWLGGEVLFGVQALTDVTALTRIVRRFIAIDARIFAVHGSADLVTHVDAAYALRGYAVAVCDVAGSLVAVVVYALLLLIQGAWPLAVVLGFALVRLGVGLRTRRRITDLARVETRHQAAELSVATAALTMPEQMACRPVAKALLEQYCNEVAKRLAAAARKSTVLLRIDSLVRLTDATEYAALLAIVGASICLAHTGVGTAFGVLLLQGLLSRHIDSAVGQLERIADLQATIDRADELLSWPLERRGGRSVSRVGAVEFDSVWFRYGASEPWLIQEGSFRLEPGEIVAITGPSGGGKSTLLKLLLGLHAADRGTIHVDGTDIAEIDLASMRRRVGYVVQDARFTSDTILANITCGVSVPIDDVRWACNAAVIWDDICRLPHGLHSRISWDGRELSGGQRQRLALARALARRPDLLLIDEGTSALDPELELEVLRNLRDTGCAILTVAHRDAAIRLTDRVVALEGDGRVRVARLHLVPRGDRSEMALAGGNAGAR